MSKLENNFRPDSDNIGRVNTSVGRFDNLKVRSDVTPRIYFNVIKDFKTFSIVNITGQGRTNDRNGTDRVGEFTGSLGIEITNSERVIIALVEKTFTADVDA